MQERFHGAEIVKLYDDTDPNSEIHPQAHCPAAESFTYFVGTPESVSMKADWYEE